MPRKKAFTLRTDPDHLDRWRTVAKSEGRSLSGWITHTCDVAAAAAPVPPGKPGRRKKARRKPQGEDSDGPGESGG